MQVHVHQRLGGISIASISIISVCLRGHLMWPHISWRMVCVAALPSALHPWSVTSSHNPSMDRLWLKEKPVSVETSLSVFFQKGQMQTSSSCIQHLCAKMLPGPADEVHKLWTIGGFATSSKSGVNLGLDQVRPHWRFIPHGFGNPRFATCKTIATRVRTETGPFVPQVKSEFDAVFALLRPTSDGFKALNRSFEVLSSVVRSRQARLRSFWVKCNLSWRLG